MSTTNLSESSSAHQLALEQPARFVSEAREAAVRRLHRIVVALSTAITPEHVARTILKGCFSAMDAAGGAIYVLDESDDSARLHLFAESDHPDGARKVSESFPLALASPVADAARTREALFFKNQESCGDAYPELREALHADGFEASAALPLVVNGASVAVLSVGYHTARSFDEPDRSFLLMLAELGAMALDRARLIQDLTRDRKAAEDERTHATELAAALEEQRRLLGAVLQQAPLGIAIADAASGRIVATNPAMDRIWQGSTPKHVTEPGTLRVSYEDGRPRYPNDSALGRALRGETVTENVRVEHADGSQAWIHVSSAPVRDESGGIIAAIGLGEDISQQVQLTAARHQLLKQVSNQRAQLSALLQQLPVAAIVFQPPDFRIEMINDAYAAIIHGRDVVGKTLREAFPDVPVDANLQCLSEVHRLAEPRSLRERVVPLREPDGHVRSRIFNNVFQPLLDEEGLVARIVSTVVEVTNEVRERESLADFAEGLRIILDEMPLGVVVRDARAGEVILANKSSKDILRADLNGLDQTEIVTVWDARFPDGRPLGPDDHAFRKAILTRADVPAQVVVLHQAETGEERVVRSTAAHLRGNNGAALVISVFEDITDEHRLLMEREQAVRFAEKFVGVLGHDLRTPLNSVSVAAALLEVQGELPEKDLKIVRLIRSSADRMTRMVTQLLDLTRGRLGGGFPVDRKRTDFVTVISRVLEELATANPAAKLLPDLPFEPTWGHWDGDRLEQVVTNLVSNAIEHGDVTKPIKISLAEDDAKATFKVHSEGPPIPEALLPIIFDPYRRGREVKATSKGLGLGLYIVREIVTAHGGEVHVTSTASEGTSFAVILPRST